MQTRSLFVRPACTYSTLTPYALHSTPYTLHQITNALATNVSAAKHFFFFFAYFFVDSKKNTTFAPKFAFLHSHACVICLR